MTISKWSTTAGSNDTADPTINWQENQAPSTVNNSARAMMAAVRSWYEDAEWRDWGHTVTRTGNTTFTISTDVTSIYVANRPIRCTDSSTLYGYVASSSYSAPNTTVTVTLDSGNLSASLSAVALGFDSSRKPIDVSSVRNAVSLNTANTFTADQTIQSTDAGATVGPQLILDRNSASPAASDVLGGIIFKGRDSGTGTDTYAQIQAEIVDATSTSEDGQITWQTKVAGTLANRGYIAQGLVLGSPTGGDKGVGTWNATAGYINGSSVGIPSENYLTSYSPSGASSVDITSVLGSSIFYKFKFFFTVSAGTDILIRYSNDNSTFKSDANYHSIASGKAGDGTAIDTETNSGTSIRLNPAVSVGSNSAAGLYGWFDLYNPAASGTRKVILGQIFFTTSEGTPRTAVANIGGDYYGTTSAVTAIQFVFSGGNGTGQIHVYNGRTS